jgi:hypothetical protein
LWSGKPISVRLDDLDKICAALDCTVADLLEAEPVADAEGGVEQIRQAASGNGRLAGQVRPGVRRGGPGSGRRSLPPS